MKKNTKLIIGILLFLFIGAGFIVLQAISNNLTSTQEDNVVNQPVETASQSAILSPEVTPMETATPEPTAYEQNKKDKIEVKATPSVQDKEKKDEDKATRKPKATKKPSVTPTKKPTGAPIGNQTTPPTVAPETTPTVKPPENTCTIEVTCMKLLSHYNSLLNYQKYIPKDGVLAKAVVEIKEGDTVFSVLSSVLARNQIPMTTVESSLGIYVNSINYLPERITSDSDGWCYYVNDVFPSVSMDQYELKAGDRIRVEYST